MLRRGLGRPSGFGTAGQGVPACFAAANSTPEDGTALDVTPPVGIDLRGGASSGGKPLFPEIRLTLAPGRWTCLLGPSGVGKTTLLRLVAGLETHVDFSGSIRAADGGTISDRVAYMAQSDLLLPWSNVVSNVVIGARLRGEAPDWERARRLVDQVGLSEHAGKRPAKLSGGQRQRVALARTLMEDRPVILLDEPFSSLDARTRMEMQDLSARLLVGRTMLQVTHDPAEAARIGNAVYLLKAGGLDELGVPPSGVPRPVDDPGMLEFQGKLAKLLLEKR